MSGGLHFRAFCLKKFKSFFGLSSQQAGKYRLDQEDGDWKALTFWLSLCPIKTKWLFYWFSHGSATCFDQHWSFSSSDMAKYWLGLLAWGQFSTKMKICQQEKREIQITVHAVNLFLLLSLSSPSSSPATSSSSCSSSHWEGESSPALTLVAMEPSECNQSGQGCLMEFIFAIQQHICLAWADSHRFIHLSL